MSLFKRIKNIIKSNINYSESIPEPDIDLDLYEDIYYDDPQKVPEGNALEKKYYKILELEYGSDFGSIKRLIKSF